MLTTAARATHLMAMGMGLGDGGTSRLELLERRLAVLWEEQHVPVEEAHVCGLFRCSLRAVRYQRSAGMDE